jgi:hypothetical protein
MIETTRHRRVQAMEDLARHRTKGPQVLEPVDNTQRKLVPSDIGGGFARR